MAKTAKIWLLTGIALVALGSLLFVGVIAVSGWDFTKLETTSYITNTYRIDSEFDNISIIDNTTDITFLPAENEDCKIVCFEDEKIKHSATTENGTLTITLVDTRQWYDYIGIFNRSPKMTLYLPQTQYASLSIETDTGDITVPKDFSFTSVKIDGDTSDVDFFASVTNAMEAEVSTGNIYIDTIAPEQLQLTAGTGNITVNSATVKKEVSMEVDTGNINLTDISCEVLETECGTGDVALKNVVAADRFSIETDTGDVRFTHSDAAQIFVETNTGDVTGTLLSEKVFITETSTGRVRVPKTTSGGKCEIITSTGDIKIDIAT